jgi:hypothetical protein
MAFWVAQRFTAAISITLADPGFSRWGAFLRELSARKGTSGTRVRNQSLAFIAALRRCATQRPINEFLEFMQSCQISEALDPFSFLVLATLKNIDIPQA